MTHTLVFKDVKSENKYYSEFSNLEFIFQFSVTN